MPEITNATYAIIAAASLFGAVLLLASSVVGALIDRRQVYRGLRTVRTIELTGSQDIGKRELAAPALQRLVVPAMGRLTRLGRRLTPGSVAERLEQELDHAGSPPDWDAGRILAYKVLLPAAMVPAVIFGAPVLGLGVPQVVVLAAVSAFVGWYLPEWILRAKAGERQAQIQCDLPDALDLLSITVEAGLGFDAAVARVAREIDGPVGEELHRVVREIQLGEERIEALRNLGERNAVTELKSFVLAMIQADILGIAVSNVLEVQAREMRIKRRQRAEERAQKLPVKIVFPLIFCVFPALFVVLLGPAAIQIYETIFQVF